ncbi:hypothetical protein CMMCAS03_08320 [Clavibacter michiganensis subsp. michiganensis]|nr:hypothetical protein CMMCAS03_08320 [Clavibacter michiganensis subsp. michiganensis]
MARGLLAHHAPGDAEHHPGRRERRQRERAERRPVEPEELAVPRLEGGDGAREQHAVGRQHGGAERRLAEEGDRLAGALVGAEQALVVEGVDLRVQLGVRARRRLDAHELARLGPLGHVPVGPAGDRRPPLHVRAEERVGEDHVHPGEQVGVVRAVGALDAVAVDVGALHLAVVAADAPADVDGGVPVAERGGDDPAHGAGEPAERILAVARPVVDPGHGARVQRLHEEGADPRDERRHPAVHGPDRGAGPEPAGVVAVLQVLDPLGSPLGVRGERLQDVGLPAVRESAHVHEPIPLPAP